MGAVLTSAILSSFECMRQTTALCWSRTDITVYDFSFAWDSIAAARRRPPTHTHAAATGRQTSKHPPYLMRNSVVCHRDRGADIAKGPWGTSPTLLSLPWAGLSIWITRSLSERPRWLKLLFPIAILYCVSCALWSRSSGGGVASVGHLCLDLHRDNNLHAYLGGEWAPPPSCLNVWGHFSTCQWSTLFALRVSCKVF